MHISEVPQDDAGVLAGFKELTYARDDGGQYIPVPCAGWDPANIANHQEWERLDQEVAGIAAEVVAGRRSPLAYWMALMQMDVELLSDYTGLWKWRIRRHQRPEIFAHLPTALLERHAQVLGLDIDTLQRLPDPLILPSQRRDRQSRLTP